MPNDVNVTGALKLRGRTSLKSLPAGLTVEGSLDSDFGRALEGLPAGIHVAGHCTCSIAGACRRCSRCAVFDGVPALCRRCRRRCALR